MRSACSTHPRLENANMIVVRPRHLAATFVAAIVLTFAASQPVRAQDFTASIRYKGITLTPIGFVAAEGVWRQRNITADIGSSYNAIPFSGTTNANMTESRLTGRQSRIGLLVQGGTVGATKVNGFWESDFLGVGTTSNSNESNSYVLRLRQFWGSAAFDNGWTLSAGQMWSLVTPNKTGMLNRSEAVPLTIEAQYAAGFDWARQFGFRLVNKFSDEGSFGIALEASQTTFSGRNLPANFVTGQAGGSQLNATTTYSTDYSPDLVVKLAFDPKGMGHWEIKAVGSEFRDRIIDPATLATSRNVTTTAYGIGAGVWFPITNGKRSIVDLGLSGMYGQGIGRYGTSQLPDATIAADTFDQADQVGARAPLDRDASDDRPRHLWLRRCRVRRSHGVRERGGQGRWLRLAAQQQRHVPGRAGDGEQHCAGLGRLQRGHPRDLARHPWLLVPLLQGIVRHAPVGSSVLLHEP